MTRAKPLVALLLALILMLGSVVAAVARSEMAGATSFALCGTGPATVLLDPVGHAVQARHACPHCLATGLAAILPPASHTPEPGAINPQPRPAMALDAPLRQTPPRTARGPPTRI